MGGGLNQAAQPVTIFPEVGANQQMRFRAGVWAAFERVFNHATACMGRFEKELIVADQRDRLVGKIQAVFAKHLARPDLPQARKLVEEVIHCGLGGCHGVNACIQVDWVLRI